jgi:hypothetical protein
VTRAVLVAAVLAAGAAAASVPGPDPATQAQADGCRRDAPSVVERQAPEWTYVGDHALPAAGPPPPARWASGVVDSPVPQLASHPTGTDLPFTHQAYDLNVNVRVDAAFAGLLGGQRAARTGNFAPGEEESGRLHVELEESAAPFFVWPEAGDRVRILGAWIWDCGHWTPGGERTELHPVRALWVQRALSSRSPTGEAEGDLLVTNARTVAGLEEDCAHSARADAAAFRSCVSAGAAAPGFHDVDGRYSFFLPAPPRPSSAARLRVRVLDERSVGAPGVSVTPGRRGATVSFQVTGSAERPLTVAKRVLLGWAPAPETGRPEHLRVTLERLLVRRAMDPGCPHAVAGCASPETTRGDQISTAPGEWLVYVDVAGLWQRLPLMRVRDGQTVVLNRAVDVYVPRGRPWRVLAYARECDFGTAHLSPCPATAELGSSQGDDVPGVAFAPFGSPEAALGEHRVDARLDSGSSCPPVNRRGCYRLGFRVQRLGPS